MAWVVENSNRSVYLSINKPALARTATQALSGLLDRYLRRLAPLPGQAEMSPELEPEIKPVSFWLRFNRLKDWNNVKPVTLPGFSGNYLRGRCIVELTNPNKNVVFVQVATESGCVLNVAMPPAGTAHPVRCQLVVAATNDAVSAHIRLSTEWANAALQYMAQGYVDKATQLVEAGKERQPSRLSRLLLGIANRFEDPAAALVPRYLGLRTREATLFNTLGESLLDVVHQPISDGHAISCELAARKRNFQLAASHLLNIPAGGLPLFTEGFSILAHRTQDLLDFDPETTDEEDRPTTEQLTALMTLRRILSKWAPYIDLNCPTTTFPGSDIAAPKTDEPSVSLTAENGWIAGPQLPTN
jgi:hypothetical protein